MTDAKKQPRQPKPKPGLKRSLDQPSPQETLAVSNVIARMLGSSTSLTSQSSQSSPTSLTSQTDQTSELASPEGTIGDNPEKSSTTPTSKTSHTTPSSLSHQTDSSSNISSQSSKASKTSLASQTSDSIAPVRDFMRVPNSLTREIVPAGLFVGKSKQLYDFLYSQTRGAIVPRRTIRMSREELMDRSGIGSAVTLRLNLKRLQEIGLIRMRSIIGSHEGNEFEVLMPGEASLDSPTSETSQSSYSQKVDRLVIPESSPTSYSSISKNKEDNNDRNTLNNTLDHDDDIKRGLKEFFPSLDQDQIEKASQEITGLLWSELKHRASLASTPPISPAFFVEAVRRLCTASQSRDQAKSGERPTSSNVALKARLKAIVDGIRTAAVGGPLPPSELEERVRAQCQRDGVLFDKQIFNEIVG